MYCLCCKGHIAKLQAFACKRDQPSTGGNAWHMQKVGQSTREGPTLHAQRPGGRCPAWWAVSYYLCPHSHPVPAMQARPEHSMVLRPGRAGECCSLTLEYTQPLDAALPPSLVIELANPRVLLLFRRCSSPPLAPFVPLQLHACACRLCCSVWRPLPCLRGRTAAGD